MERTPLRESISARSNCGAIARLARPLGNVVGAPAESRLNFSVDFTQRMRSGSAIITEMRARSRASFALAMHARKWKVREGRALSRNCAARSAQACTPSRFSFPERSVPGSPISPSFRDAVENAAPVRKEKERANIVRLIACAAGFRRSLI